MKLINLLPKQPKRWVLLRQYQGRLVIFASVGLTVFIVATAVIFALDFLLVTAREKLLTAALQETENAITELSSRQAVFLAVKNKSGAINRLNDGRFPYDQVLTSLFALFSPGVKLTSLTLDREGHLVFSLEAKDASSVQALIGNILAHDFSPAYSYTLKGSARNADGTYTLDFSFTRKS